ncbi:hypothetical protein [Oricola indica]|uniref:hypothetical protein n=1 Tax=Oricola indica TaxID=2872591 RepID=UPI001CBAA17A|nr:hypothetical protein [Oricola indica]
MVNDYWEVTRVVNTSTSGEIFRLQYVCASCQKFERYFIIKIDEERGWISKVGQYPPWSVKTDANLSALLGEHKDYLASGLILESQGYGIGAFAYYRRIVEETIDELLSDVGELLAGEEKETYLTALSAVRKTRVTAEKIDLVKDLLPPILRPDGMNPLRALHEALSEGLHAQTDENCLTQAMIIRELLVYLATQLAASRNAAKSFTDNMRKLLDAKTSKS